MKKILFLIILVAVGAGSLFFVRSSSQSKSSTTASQVPDPAQMKKPGASISVSNKPEEIAQPPKGSAPKKDPTGPLRIGFKLPNEASKSEQTQVTLLLASNAENWPLSGGNELKLQFLLRLPAGIKLISQGWSPKTLSKEEQNDPSGPWFLYEKELPLVLMESTPPSVLAQLPIDLAVVEDGTNWVITTRARLVHQDQAWQTFGALFATRKSGQVQLHDRPQLDFDLPNAIGPGGQNNP